MWAEVNKYIYNKVILFKKNLILYKKCFRNNCSNKTLKAHKLSFINFFFTVTWSVKV